MKARKVVLVLTLALVVVGAAALIFNALGGGGSETTYANLELYDAARAGGDLPPDVPALPKCAEAIVLLFEGGSTKEVSFSCSSRAEREAYVAQVKSGFLWNILFFEPDRVKLERAAGE